MDKYFEHHKWYQIGYKNKDKVYKAHYLSCKKELKNYLNKFIDAKVLEIGSWMWKFAYFCDKIWVKDYTWIDIDDYFFEGTRKDFPNYKFIKIRFQKYLKEHKNEFDIIFVSHVFEHLDEKERIEMVESIYCWLKENGIWINYMPNADAIFLVWYWRRCDLTHKNIYNESSFFQLISSCNCNFTIENFNKYIWSPSKIRRLIHLIFLFFTKIYFLGMWFTFPNFYTREFWNILTKKS